MIDRANSSSASGSTPTGSPSSSLSEAASGPSLADDRSSNHDHSSGAERGRTGTGQGYGKVILFGEHAVVYDQPAIAAGLARRIVAEAFEAPGEGRLLSANSRTLASMDEGSPLGRAFAAILRTMGSSHLDVSVTGDLPPRSGLGSSAALAVAVARAVAAADGRDPTVAMAAAAEAEIVFHGSPSGIDLAVAASGGIGRFQRPVGWHPLTVPQSFTLCIGLSGVERDTRAQVEAVRRLRARTASVATVMETLGAVSEAGQMALQRGDVDELGRLFDVAHGLLSALRVSSAALDQLVHQARAAGALGAKLTGAGGGGAVIALAPGHEEDVLARWKAGGFDGFATTIGPVSLMPPRRNASVGDAPETRHEAEIGGAGGGVHSLEAAVRPPEVAP